MLKASLFLPDFPWKLTGNKKTFVICRPEDVPLHYKA